MNDELSLRAAPGFVDPVVALELPGLRLLWQRLDARERTSPPALIRQLRDRSNRVRGGDVIATRTQPIPSAYRSFFRQIGMDPDRERIPSEQAAVDRLFYGGFRSAGLVPDALLLALVETGVPIWALDGDRVGPGGLGIRTAVERERLGEEPTAPPVAPGTLVVADETCVHGVLFGPTAPDSAVSRRTRRLVLFSVAVSGVPDIHVEEAFWLVYEALNSAL